jgi:hypothetical protein
MKDFFISYNRADKGWAEWIAWQLEAAGQDVTLQAWDFRQGGNYVLDMQRAVNESQRTLIVLSPDFLASQYAAPEWAAAFALDPTGAQGRLLPVRVRECQPTGLLAQIVYVDLVGLKTGQEARERLLQGASQARAKPDDEPDMPPLEVATSPPSSLAEEPPWPPALEVASSVVGRIFWRVLRFAALAIAAGLAVQAVLTRSLPHWAANSPGALMTAALLWGLLCALAVEALVRLLQRRGIRRRSKRSPT